MLIEISVSSRISYSIVVFLYVSFNGLITSVGAERVIFSAIVYLQLCSFFSRRFPHSLGVWDRLRYFILALQGPSI